MTDREIYQEKIVIRPRPPSPEAVVASRLIYYLLDIVEVFLAFRFLLKAFRANATAGFASFIYSFTYPLVVPFFGIFPASTIARMEIEWATLLAMFVYLLVAMLVIRLIRIFIK